MKYIVYQTVNKVNNKIYIGVHGTEIDDFDGYIGNGVSIYRPATYMNPKTPFQFAVKKYGIKCGLSISPDTDLSFLEPYLRKYRSGDSYSIMLSFGSILPPLALLPFLSVYSKISVVDIEFLHDKWEVRGDYTSKNRVGIAFANGEFVVGDSKKIKRQATGKSTTKKKWGEGFKSMSFCPQESSAPESIMLKKTAIRSIGSCQRTKRIQ